MAADRFIWFKSVKAPVPPKEDVQKVLEDYLGDAGVVTWDGNRFYATLIGKPSFPFKRVSDVTAMCRDDERWIEVYMGKDNLDVITRMQDHFTNAIADGIAESFANFWNGSLDME